MADYVASQTISLDDQVSAGAQAAADALGKLADAGDAAAASTDNVTATVTMAGASAATLARSFDPATKAAADLAAAQNKLAAAQETMGAAVAAGTATQAQADAVMAGLTGKVRAAQAAVDQFSASSTAAAKAAAGMTEANAEAANSATAAGAAHAGFYREIVILGHEVVSGNFNRIPGSLLVLAERSGNLDSIFQGVIKTVTSLPGILALAGVAGVAAMAAMGVSADNAIQRNITLQDQLKATRDDYAAMALEAAGAARIASQATPELSSADANTAADTLAAAPQFTGTTQQLANLIELAARMGVAFKETADKAAGDLAAAMENPGQAADRLVGHLRGMTQPMADYIANLAAAGDKAGAFAAYADVMGKALDGVGEHLSPLRQALRDIETAFNDGGASGGSFGAALQTAVIGPIYSVLEAVAHLLEGLKKIHDWDAQYLPWAQGYGSAGGSAASGSVADTISSVGASLNAPAAVVSLAQRIAPVESSTGQYDASGGVVTSSAGALGAMQVMPGNANGQDLTTLHGNVTAAEQYLITLWTKYHGDERLVTMAYNWGPGNVDAMLANGTAAPASVQKYAADVAAGSTGANATNSVGVSNSATAIQDQAGQAAESSLAANIAKTQAQIMLLRDAKQAYEDAGQTGSTAWHNIASKLDEVTLAYSNMQDPQTKALTALSNQRIAQDNLSTAYGQGYAAVEKATAQNAAYATAVQTVGEQSNDFDATVDRLTASHIRLAEATAKTAVAQQTLSNGDQLEYLKAETDSIGENTDKRNLMLANLKAEQELRAKNVDALSAEGQAYLASVAAITAQSDALAKSQQTMSDIENLATQAFDQVGSAITNAFAQGGKSAVDFGSVIRTVMASVEQELIKVAVLNPVLNSLFGGNRTTLGDITSLLGGGSGGGGGFSLSGLANLFGGGGGDAAGSVTNLGAVDIQSGLYTQTPTLNVPATGGGLGSFLNTGTIGTGTIGSTLGGVGLGFGAGSLLGSLVGGNSENGQIGAGVGALSGALIGSIVPGIGTLIGGAVGGLIGGLGSLFGNQLPSDKTQYTHESLSTRTGQNLGNKVGGTEYSAQNASAAANLADNIYQSQDAITSAFGLQNLNTTLDAKVGSRDGIFVKFDSANGPQFKADNSAGGAATVTNESVGYIIDQLKTGFDATTTALLKGIDYSKSTAGASVSALAAATTNGQLDATQKIALPNINLANNTQAISDLGWIKNTYETTVNSATDQGSIATQTAAVNASFTDLIAHAQRLGLATDVLTAAQGRQVQAITDATNQTIAASGASILSSYQKENGDSLGSQLTTFDQNSATAQLSLTAEFKGLFGNSYATQADYVRQVGLLTSTLAAQRSDLIASFNEQQQAQQDTTGANWTANITAGWKAQASIAANSNDLGTVQWGQQLNEAADLANFDAQAKTTTDSYSAQLIAAYGQGYTKSATYAAQMVALEQSLAEQRLAIQSTYAQQAKQMQSTAEQSASGVITSLTSYVQGLQTGSTSPLNAQSQYTLAQQQFNAVQGAAQAGNVTSIGELQQYASAFLAASQNLYGSGAGYATDFQNVLSSLQAVAAIPQSTLTADFMQAALQSQTDQLAAAIAGLRGDVQGIKLALSQQAQRSQAA